jgi:hypothetical protein
VSNFTEKYYKENLPSVHDHSPRYNVVENQSKLSLFQGQFGSASASTTKQLTNEEWRSIMLYVLLNSPEVEPYKQDVDTKSAPSAKHTASRKAGFARA